MTKRIVSPFFTDKVEGVNRMLSAASTSIVRVTFFATPGWPIGDSSWCPLPWLPPARATDAAKAAAAKTKPARETMLNLWIFMELLSGLGWETVEERCVVVMPCGSVRHAFAGGLDRRGRGRGRRRVEAGRWARRWRERAVPFVGHGAFGELVRPGVLVVARFLVLAHLEDAEHATHFQRSE